MNDGGHGLSSGELSRKCACIHCGLVRSNPLAWKIPLIVFLSIAALALSIAARVLFD